MGMLHKVQVPREFVLGEYSRSPSALPALSESAVPNIPISPYPGFPKGGTVRSGERWKLTRNTIRGVLALSKNRPQTATSDEYEKYRIMTHAVARTAMPSFSGSPNTHPDLRITLVPGRSKDAGVFSTPSLIVANRTRRSERVCVRPPGFFGCFSTHLFWRLGRRLGPDQHHHARQRYPPSSGHNPGGERDLDR